MAPAQTLLQALLRFYGKIDFFTNVIRYDFMDFCTIFFNFFLSKFRRIYLQSSLKLQIFGDIYLPPVASEASGERLLIGNRFGTILVGCFFSGGLSPNTLKIHMYFQTVLTVHPNNAASCNVSLRLCVPSCTTSYQLGKRFPVWNF